MSWEPLEYEMEAGKGPLRYDRGSGCARFAPVRKRVNVVLTLKAMDLNPSVCP